MTSCHCVPLAANRSPASHPPATTRLALAALFVGVLSACGGGGGSDTAAPVAGTPGAGPSPASPSPASPSPGPSSPASPAPTPVSGGGPAAGNPTGSCAVPTAAQPVNTSSPTHVIGTGTAASCTSAAVVAAVAQGGSIRFNCGPDPVTITMTATAKVFNDKPDVTIDGGGLVTLSGGGVRRILYQNTCDQAQVWTSARCDLQNTPRLTVQNLTMVQGNSAGSAQSYGLGEVYGGGAIYVRGGQLKIVNSRFFNHQCESTGPDLGGAAVRAFGTSGPVYVVGSTFGGAAGYGNTCSNGAALSGLGASFSVINSLFSHNTAVGNGANPQRAGTPGGGSGGAIYQDGDTMDLSVCGSYLHDNTANEGGSAIFFVSNDLSGTMSITDSVLENHPFGRFETSGLPGFFVLAAAGQPVVTRSTIRR